MIDRSKKKIDISQFTQAAGIQNEWHLYFLLSDSWFLAKGTSQWDGPNAIYIFRTLVLH